MIQLYKEIKERIVTVKNISDIKTKLSDIKKRGEFQETKEETMGYYKTILQIKRHERIRLTQENFLLSYISNHKIKTQEQLRIFYDQSMQIMQAINSHFIYSTSSGKKICQKKILQLYFHFFTKINYKSVSKSLKKEIQSKEPNRIPLGVLIIWLLELVRNIY